MRVAFYAPLKPVDHPVPSGDRQLGQAVLRALRAAGHDAFVASRLRTFDRNGDGWRQARLADIGQRMALRLFRRYRQSAMRPDVWFTYHLYHKAPDWLGPAVSRALDIPYVIAEASAAPKQRDGKWAVGYAASVAAIKDAAATIFFNPVDVPGIRNLRGPAREDECVPPFVDVASFAAVPAASAADVPRRGRRLRLVTVAMMRPGAKLASYRVLADALARVPSADWELVIVGDGSARTEVNDAFARFDQSQIRRVGFQDAAHVAAWLRSSDIFVWPAIDEAFGMAFIEAQACGLPVIAGNGGGVASVVAADRTGLLVPLGDAAAFARAIERLMTETPLRQRMAAEALAYVTSQHDLSAAAVRLDAVLRRVRAEHGSVADRADQASARAR